MRKDSVEFLKKTAEKNKKFVTILVWCNIKLNIRLALFSKVSQQNVQCRQSNINFVHLLEYPTC